MMDAHELTPLFSSFVAGLVTSLHCMAMCGPLGCALLWPRGGQEQNPQRALAIYHCCRLVSYIVIGCVFGAVGLPAARLFESSPVRILPWVFLCIFLLLGMGLDRRIPQPRFISHLMFRLDLRPGIRPDRTAALLGLATPFIPCGPLYMVFAAALFSGSAAGGGMLMGVFALGTLPLYWLVQTQFLRISPIWMQRGRQIFSLLAAGVLAWRMASAGAGSTFLDGILCH